MATITMSRKSGATMLSDLQESYPQLTSFTWGADASCVIESSTPLDDGGISDILAYTKSENAWDVVQA